MDDTRLSLVEQLATLESERDAARSAPTLARHGTPAPPVLKRPLVADVAADALIVKRSREAIRLSKTLLGLPP